MNLHVTGGAVGVLCVLVMLRAAWFNRSDVMRDTMASQTKLIDGGIPQQPWVRRSVRRMTGHATFSLHRSMFKGKRPLLVGVTLNASRISAGGQSRLLELEPTMRIVAVTTAHRAFQDFVMERRIECRLDLAVATDAELRVIHLQHSDC